VYPCQNIGPQPEGEIHTITGEISSNRAYLAPASEAKSNIFNIMKAIIGGTTEDPGKISVEGGASSESKASNLSRREILRLRRESRLKASKKYGSLSVPPTPKINIDSLKQKVSSRHHQRCTGTAVQIAIDLATASSCNTSRILLFTNGCPNVGVGSVISPHLSSQRKPVERIPIGEDGSSGSTCKGRIMKKKRDSVDPNMIDAAVVFFKYLGQEAFEEGIGIDAFCAGKVIFMINRFVGIFARLLT